MNTDPSTEKDLNPTKAAGSGKGFDPKEKVKSLWAGKESLFNTFWLYYFAGVFVLQLLARAIDPLTTLLSLLALIWAGFMVRPIWLAATAYQGQKVWAVLAKLIAIFIALAVLGDVFV